MPSNIVLPQLGFGIDECVLQQWLVSDGSEVKAGQPLFSVESDKATEEIEAPASGRLKIILQAGETYAVGTVLGLLE